MLIHQKYAKNGWCYLKYAPKHPTRLNVIYLSRLGGGRQVDFYRHLSTIIIF